jgi:hypothetical protein
VSRVPTFRQYVLPPFSGSLFQVDADIFERRKLDDYLIFSYIRLKRVRECLLLFGAESFVFQFAIQKFIDQDI